MDDGVAVWDDAGVKRNSGLSPHKQRSAVAAKLGVVFGKRTQLRWDLPVRDSYDILATMY